MLVIKFGGTSVSSEKNIRSIKSILNRQKDHFVVVVSALSGITNQLENLTDQALTGDYETTLTKIHKQHTQLIDEVMLTRNQTEVLIFIQKQIIELECICQGMYALGECSEKAKARVLSFGERMSSMILWKNFLQEDIAMDYIDSRELISANSDYCNAEVEKEKTYAAIRKQVFGRSYIVPGFIASNEKGETVLLGRGGSDYTAALFAAALNADQLEIWSDVSGMQTANPKVVRNTQPIDSLSYKEAVELAHFGAKVLYPPTILPVMQKNIPVYLKNTLQPENPGSKIAELPNKKEIVQGVSSLSGISLINISGVGLAGKKGRARAVFEALESARINIILISQGCSEQSICLAIKSEEEKRAEEVLKQAFSRELKTGEINPIQLLDRHAIVAVVGDGMKDCVGLSGKIFAALGENGVNIRAIAQGSSERSISIVVEEVQEAKSVNVIHERFFEEAMTVVHLFVVGVGTVGSAFLEILRNQQEVLGRDKKVRLKVIGVANSRRMIFDTKGVEVSSAKERLENGEHYDSIDEFVKQAKALNLRNSVFVDNTASESVAGVYGDFLKASFSVVTCNKIACSGSMKVYQSLHDLAEKRNGKLRYETSVGAALPVIKTIRELQLVGDQIRKIQAVISGSLNFIFNQYDGSVPFSEIVRQAQAAGFTEPDPRIDLSGMDVMRKILILSREAGFENEMMEVEFVSFLPKECQESKSLEEFYAQLDANEKHFKQLVDQATKNERRLKVVAQMNDGKLSVQLKEVAPDSVFYHLKASDNAIAIHTDRYVEPLIIQGAGAGAKVTASGVFADVISTVNQGL